MQPQLAPAYAVGKAPLDRTLKLTAPCIFPLFFAMFLVVGPVFLGVATPTESAVLGALRTVLLAWMLGGPNWQLVKESLRSSPRIAVMLLTIITGSTAFSRILAFTGATAGLAGTATEARDSVGPLTVIVIMLPIPILMGMFMEPLSIVMLTVPIYFPAIKSFGYGEIWFGAIMVLNMELATISPPFGLDFFVMRGVATEGTTMGDVYAGSIPFCLPDVLVMAVPIACPPIVLWLPASIAKG